MPNEFDATLMSYGAPRTLDSGARHVRVNYRPRRGPWYVQTPDMIAPFGVAKWENPGTSSKYSLELSFRDSEDREDLQEFRSMLDAMGSRIVDDAFSGTLQTHTKKFTSREVVDMFFQSPVKMPKDDKYAPNFKVTLPVGDKDEFTFPTYQVDAKNARPTLVDLRSVQTKGAIFTVIMQCTGIWVAGGSNFGISWKAVQVRVQPPASKTDYSFKDVGRLMDFKVEEDVDDGEELDIPAVEKEEELDAAGVKAEELKVEDGGDDIEAPAISRRG